WYGGHIDGSFLSIIYPLLDCSGIPILTTLAEVWNVRSWHGTDWLTGQGPTVREEMTPCFTKSSIVLQAAFIMRFYENKKIP
ncbi:hypothetical protein ACOTWS_23760, partial [Enterobacter cloacae complex sp. CDL009]|uniref:hypothetical protein n=1 Tax=unclassified Enterobacter cloacae complex TaxID=2757714 RepID=UPI003B9B2FD7